MHTQGRTFATSLLVGIFALCCHAVASAAAAPLMYTGKDCQMKAPPGWTLQQEDFHGGLVARFLDPGRMATIELYSVGGWPEDLPSVERKFVTKFKGGQGLFLKRVNREVTNLRGKHGVLMAFHGQVQSVETSSRVFLTSHMGRAYVVLGAYPANRKADLGTIVRDTIGTLRFRHEYPGALLNERHAARAEPVHLTGPLMNAQSPMSPPGMPAYQHPLVSGAGPSGPLVARSDQVPGGKACLNCRLEFPREARYCLKCGGDLEDSVALKKSNFSTCLTCGREVLPGGEYCANCDRVHRAPQSDAILRRQPVTNYGVGTERAAPPSNKPLEPVRTINLSELTKNCDVAPVNNSTEIICLMGEEISRTVKPTTGIPQRDVSFRPYTGRIVDDGYLEKTVFDCVNGLKHGELKVWAKDTGHLIRVTEFVHGAKNGLEKTYDRWDGFLESATAYERGIRHGLFRSYWEGGQIASEIPFIAGKAHGVSRQFNMDGTIAETVEYNRGEIKKRGPPEAFCTDCGEKIPVPSKFCLKCGSHLVMPSSRFHPVEAIQPRIFEIKRWRVAIGKTGENKSRVERGVVLESGSPVLADDLKLEVTEIEVTASAIGADGPKGLSLDSIAGATSFVQDSFGAPVEEVVSDKDAASPIVQASASVEEKREDAEDIPLVATIQYMDGGVQSITLMLPGNLETDIINAKTQWSPGRRVASIRLLHESPKMSVRLERVQLKVAN